MLGGDEGDNLPGMQHEYPPADCGWDGSSAAGSVAWRRWHSQSALPHETPLRNSARDERVRLLPPLLECVGKKDLTVRREPKRSETRVAINPPAAWLGARNAILWGKATQYRVANFRGPLSIKSVVRGSARWSTSEAERLVDETCYLVLNSEQSYSITIDSLAAVETFCLFFRNGLIEDVSRVTESGPTRLLDNPVPGASHASESAARAGNSSSLGTGVEFFETLHVHDAVVSPLIQRIYARLKD